jgi:hypothetical protein
MRVFINTDDHEPPHVHVLGPGYIAKVRIDDGSIIEHSGRSTSAAREALAWIGANRERLAMEWQSIHKGRRQ